MTLHHGMTCAGEAGERAAPEAAGGVWGGERRGCGGHAGRGAAPAHSRHVAHRAASAADAGAALASSALHACVHAIGICLHGCLMSCTGICMHVCLMPCTGICMHACMHCDSPCVPSQSAPALFAAIRQRRGSGCAGSAAGATLAAGAGRGAWQRPGSCQTLSKHAPAMHPLRTPMQRTLPLIFPCLSRVLLLQYQATLNQWGGGPRAV